MYITVYIFGRIKVVFFVQEKKEFISLDFHVVLGMERSKVIISFVRSKVDFYLSWLKYKEKKIKKNYFIFINIVTSKYVPRDMYKYQQTERS